MNKLIGYVGKNDIATVAEADLKALDIINIAFGNIVDGLVVFEGHGVKDSLVRAKSINPELKVLLSIGGWSSGGFSEAADSEAGRQAVADSLVEIVKTYGFDGVDVDWEYPCFSVAGIAGDMKDKKNFTLFLKTIRETLMSQVSQDQMLTIAAGGDAYFTRCTEMDQAIQHLDYVQLMTYDLRGGFQVLTGHHTNVYGHPADLFEASCDKAVQAYIDAGVPAEKLVLGVAYYSREWNGVPDVNHGLHQMAETTGHYGPSYGELVEGYMNKNGYTRYYDDIAKAPYLFDGKNFISYDDETSIAEKVTYTKDMGLYGMMFWEYQCDSTKTLTTYTRRLLDEQ